MYEDLGVSYSSDITLDDRIPTLIPTHNASDLLKHSFRIMIKSGCVDLIYPIIIDDRSTEDIKKLCDDYGFGYIRIDHDLSFNYSINMNIGARLLYDRDVETAMFLNNDCYLHSKENLSEFITRHFDNKSHLSCPKLVYPPVRYGFKKDIGRQNTVQFGGGEFIDGDLRRPDHFGRGLRHNDDLVNIDKKNELFVTGAMNIINLKSFIYSSMYDIELDGAYQDVMLSLCFNRLDLNVCYFGKGIYFYHDETTTRMDEWINHSEELISKYIKKVSNINSKKHKIENE